MYNLSYQHLPAEAGQTSRGLNGNVMPLQQQPVQPTQPMLPPQPFQQSQPYQQGQTYQQVQPYAHQGMTFQQGPPTTTNIGYTPAFLRTQIGRNVKVEFLIGTNMVVDREGTLVEVGIDYIILQETETDDYLLCDMYSIKFVKFFY